MSEATKAIREILTYLTPQCNFCGARFGGPGTPATRTCYFPKINSHYDNRYFCDYHDLRNYRINELEEHREHWKKWYGLEFPPTDFEFEDLPYAESIRTLVQADQDWWDARRQRFELMLIEDEKYRKREK